MSQRKKISTMPITWGKIINGPDWMLQLVGAWFHMPKVAVLIPSWG